MSGSVGVRVQNDKTVLVSMDDERFFVISRLRQLTKQASGGLMGAGHVGVTPGGKEEVHALARYQIGKAVEAGFTGLAALTVPERVAIVEGVLTARFRTVKIRPLVFEPSAQTEVTPVGLGFPSPPSARPLLVSYKFRRV